MSIPFKSRADFPAIKIEGGTGDQGIMSWNTEDETVDLIVSPDVTYQLGQELGHVVRNLSGQTIVNGNVVKITGASGNKPTVDMADSSSEYQSAATFAVVTETIGNNSTGRVTTEGLVRGLNTSAYTEGVALWLGTAGNFTDVKPLSPNHLVHIGWVVRSHATEGIILVRVSNGWELEELHDVLITDVQEGDSLAWDATLGVWKNGAASSAEGGILSVLRNNFTGDGIETTFALSATITQESQTQVYIDGVYQSKDSYTTSGSNVIFSEPISSGAGIEVIHIVSLSANVDTEIFTGDGSTVAYALSKNILDENNTQIYFDGVYQSKDNYTISGSTITFSTAPPLDVVVEVVYFSNLNTTQAGNYDVQVISTSTTAVKATVYVLTASLTLTLPIAPELGDSIKISNLSAVDTCIIARNGNNIMGLAEDLTLDSTSASFELIYANTTKGWVIIAQ